MSSSLAQQQQEFSKAVHNAFNTLRARGMEPNDAAALALKVAAGVAELPPTPEAVLEAIRANPNGQDTAVRVTRFFANGDCLLAAFWPRSKPVQQEEGSASAAAQGSGGGSGSGASSSGSGGRLPPCPLDFEGVDALYDRILSPPPASTATTDGAGGGRPTAAASANGATTDTLPGSAAPGSGRPGSSSTRPPSALTAPRLTGMGTTAAAGGVLGLSALAGALAAGVEALLSSLAHLPAGANPGLPRQMAVLLANPLLDEMEHFGLMGSLVHFVEQLSSSQKQALVALFATYPALQLRRLVARLQQYVSLTLYRQEAITRGAEDATRLLALLVDANEQQGACSASGTPPLEVSEFYNDAINNEDFNIKEDFRRWKSPFKYDFSFCLYPFMYDPASKARVLQLENQASQISELHSALFRGLFSNGPMGGLGDMCPFLVLKVRRGPYLVQDTLIQINRAKESDSLKKPLKVKFIGEEGVDEGGVAKEFFQLLVRELFNPDYGMFTIDSATRLNWFRSSPLDMDVEFELVGILIGLAIYNAQLLEFQFPRVLYKKLLLTVNANNASSAAAACAAAGGSGAASAPGGSSRQLPTASSSYPMAPAPAPAGGGPGAGDALPGSGSGLGSSGLGAFSLSASSRCLCLDDLSELWPEVCANLRWLLSYEGDMEPLGLYFQVECETGFGDKEAVDLVPGGGEVAVGQANKAQYVELYARHLLEGSVSRQFGPFQRGFLRLCGGAALAWFRPQELELLVCGGRRLDLHELEQATLYEDGYARSSLPVCWFWEVVHSWDEVMQKRLLFFVTGCDRVPIKGLAHLNPPFVISRAGAASSRLPSAHTCFNHLLLPDYTAKEVLKERLELAMQNAEGFGLM